MFGFDNPGSFRVQLDVVASAATESANCVRNDRHFSILLKIPGDLLFARTGRCFKSSSQNSTAPTAADPIWDPQIFVNRLPCYVFIGLERRSRFRMGIFLSYGFFT
jgi:hypothetical protein